MAEPGLKVLQVVTGLNVYGAERVAFALARGLAHRGQTSAVLAVTSPADKAPGAALETTLRSDGVRLIPPWPARAPHRVQMLGAAWTLSRAVRRHGYDLIHVHTDIPEFAVALGRPPRARGVRTLHNTELWPGRPAMAAFIDRRLGAFAPVAISEGALEAWGRAASRLKAGGGRSPELIRNAAGLDPLQALTRAAARQVLGVAADEVTLAFVGRLVEQKGFDVLMQAVRSPKWPAGVSLQVCGDGPLRPALEAARAAGAPVRWRGVLDDVSRLYCAFDGLLAPSRFEGATPLAVLDALVLGLPVAATRCPGIAGDPTADSVVEITALSPEGVCEAAAALVDHRSSRPPPTRDLSTDAMIDAYLSLYRRIIAEP